MKKCSVLMIAEDPDNHTRICDDNNMRWYDPESSSWYKYPADFILPLGEFKALRENPPINWKILNWEYDGKFGQCGQFVNVEFTDENMPKFCYVEKISTRYLPKRALQDRCDGICDEIYRERYENILKER